jgi:alpha-1,2-mannosyltransferase
MEAHPLPVPAGPAARRHALRQRWFLVGLALFFVVINIQYVVKIARSDREARSAFVRWSNQIVDLQYGVDIWARHNYPNPPIMALILDPLVQLPPLAGSLAWFYLKVAMAVLCLHWVLKLLDRGERPFPWWAKVLTVLLCLRPIAGDLVHGNVNLFILFLVVGALVSFCRRRDLLAGALLGLAIACKVTPALFVPYFLWKRAWKTLAGTTAGITLFVWVIPGLVLGWQENHQYLTSWYRNMVQPFAEGKVTSEAVNQSLPGLMSRLLTHHPSFVMRGEEAYIPTEYHNVLDLSDQAVQWLLRGCFAGFAVLVIWRCRTPTADRGSWRLLAEFSVIILGMLLLSERTWKHHCVTLLLPFAVLCYSVSALRWPRRRRWYLGATIAAAFGLITLTGTTGLSAHQDRFGDLAQVYGAYVWAFLLLLAAMLALLGESPAVPTPTVMAEH